MSGTAPAVRPTVVLTDIEGTTSAISFVKDTLFPFARAALDGAPVAEPARGVLQDLVGTATERTA